MNNRLKVVLAASFFMIASIFFYISNTRNSEKSIIQHQNQHHNEFSSSSDISYSAASRKNDNNGIANIKDSDVLSRCIDNWQTTIKENSDPQRLCIQLNFLIQSMSKEGMHVEEIKNLIDQSFGVGMIRTSLYREMFACTPLSEESILVFKNLRQEEKDSAINGIATGLGASGNYNVELLTKLELSHEEYQRLVSKSLEQRFLLKYAEDQSYDCKILDFSKDLNLELDGVNNLKKFIASRDPFGLYDYLVKSGDIPDKDMLGVIATNALQKSPSLAMGLFARDSRMSEYVSNAALKMMKIDRESYDAWYANEGKNLSNTAKDHLNLAETKFNLSAGSLDLAKSSVNNIIDPVVRKQAEGQVWSKEREMVRSAASQNPQQALADLIGGKSQHEPYWIEEVMDVWINKDFAQAEKWYQDNWNKIPAEKSQYMASSFAVRAIKAGDAVTAAQWIPYIQDPKTKTRVERELHKIQK